MTRNEDTILVTGATGTVGSEVVRQLSSSGQRVKAAIHTQNKAHKFKDDSAVDLVNIDYTKPETLADGFKGVDKLFLLTSISPNMQSISSNLVNAAKQNAIKYIVKLSVMAADSEPGTIIARLHRQEEKIIEDSEIPYNFLRPGAFMQNFVNYFGETIKNQNAIHIPAGEGKVSFVDVRDIASVAVALLTRNDAQYTNKAYTITGQEVLSYGQAAEILSKELGRTISYIDIPEPDARKAMMKMGMEDWLIDAMMEPYTIIKSGHGSQTTSSIEEVTGRKPILFSQFAKDYAQALR
ncbi:MAG: SDR family oxidoreductase [Nitrososphaeraceae archaeon]